MGTSKPLCSMYFSMTFKPLCSIDFSMTIKPLCYFGFLRLLGRPLLLILGSGCGSVDRVVASNKRGLRFESSHWHKIILNIFTVNCIEKTQLKAKDARNCPFF